jgi:hypothetical protein
MLSSGTGIFLWISVRLAPCMSLISPVQKSITKVSLIEDGTYLFENECITSEIIIEAAIMSVDVLFIL